MITIKNLQRKYRLDKKDLQCDMKAIIAFAGYKDFQVSLTFVSSKKIQEYNRTYRGKDKPTDILSFSFYQHLTPGKKLVLQKDDPKDLGDLIICPERVAIDAVEYGMTFDQRLRQLLVHGICHLLGYDHERDADYEIMHAEEERILALLSGNKSKL